MNTNCFNTIIKDIKYRTEGNTVYCDIVVKVNLRDFENQHYGFTPKFVRTQIGQYLPIIKTVANFCYSDTDPVVAKYYLLPGGNAKVLEYNREYYKKFRGLDNEDLLAVGQFIPVKRIEKPFPLAEVVTHDYCESFVVTGKAVCAEGDEFKENVGKALAESRACIKIANRINGLFKTIQNRTKKAMDIVTKATATSDNWVSQAQSTNNSLNEMYK